jgi:hypothetical protein
LLYQLSYGLAGGAMKRDVDPRFRQAADSKVTQTEKPLQPMRAAIPPKLPARTLQIRPSYQRRLLINKFNNLYCKN